MVRVTFGYPQVPLDAMSIWGGSDRGGLDGLRFQRLDGAENDHVISQEVLAAHLNGRQDLLRHYIRERLERREPVEVARALMVAGFSDHDPFNDNVLDRYQGTDGFIGDVHDAARYAYDRNTDGRGIGSNGCVTRATAWSSGVPPFCSRRSSTDDTIFGSRSTRFEANPCGCSGPASETSCGIESGSGQINARRSCSDKRFQRKFFFVRGDPSSLGQPDDGHGAVNHAPSPV